uniref:TACC_C domain-containing protein n=1 Tax=Steinernema glaseri TaxID=37863 RepID=A0A1I7ZRL5_9BILA
MDEDVSNSLSEEFMDAEDMPLSLDDEPLPDEPRDDCVTPTPTNDEWGSVNASANGAPIMDMRAAELANGAQADFLPQRRLQPVMQSTPIRPPMQTDSGTMPRPTRTNVGALPVVTAENSQSSTTEVQPIPIKKRTRQQTVTVKSKLAEAVTEAFQAAKKDENVNIEDLERRIQLAVMASDRYWSDKVARAVAAVQQEFAKKEAAMGAVIQQLEESEKQFHDKCIHLAQSGMKMTRNGRSMDSLANGLPSPSNEKMQAEVAAALKERDRMAEEFGTLENNYGDLFRRYEMLREQSQTLRDNEAKLKQEAEKLAVKNHKLQQKLEMAGMQARETLAQATEEIDRLHEARETDNLALRMKVKQYGIQVASLEATVAAKNNELEELQQICNELLQKADIHDE